MPVARKRDEFSERTRIQIAKRAGWVCSFPGCHVHTVGATADGKGEFSTGVAAHICAAAPGGPRYDEKMLPAVRSSADNGIWLCQNHAKLIDTDVIQYPVSLLQKWKEQASEDSRRRVVAGVAASAPTIVTDAELAERLRAAAAADLDIFRANPKWPQSSVPLTLAVEGIEAPVTTDALASIVTKLDDLVLVAGPGMGKTSTLFQIASGIIGNKCGVPLVVLLNEWSTEGSTLLASILKRPSFTGISEEDFRKVAAQTNTVLLLDGWNELDADARKRARYQVNALQAEQPKISLVISARKPRNQVFGVPFSGTRVDLLPLNDEQQLQIARAIRGDEGARLIDEAWRTAGVREMVTIPLYLAALLGLPVGAPFPTTKEEVLRHFVTAHEANPDSAEEIHAATHGFHQSYLDELAGFATRAASTAIAEPSALRCVSGVSAALVQDGQIAVRPEPSAILEVLVSRHVLMRAGDTPGVSFQHQQIQEYYASHIVEHRILGDIEIVARRAALQAEIFDYPAWEEAILFAVERMSRSSGDGRVACGKAILAAFEVDPILAAEMIFRCTDEVWAQVASSIQALVKRWHSPKKIDRALRFMLVSGRAEFLDVVWPLITNEDKQTSLLALRNCRRFRTSSLGHGAAERIKALAEGPREVLLHEIAMRGRMDGLDLATSIAKDDPVPKVRASVVDALTFRRADRHVVEILRVADEATVELIARRNLIDVVDDEYVKERIEGTRKRLVAEATSVEGRLRLIANTLGKEDHGAELTRIVSTVEIDKNREELLHLLHTLRDGYQAAIAEGILVRVRNGLTLFYRADDILASSRLIVEDEDLLRLALADPETDSIRADAAASVLGPRATGSMIDALLDLVPHVLTDHAASRAYSGLQRRIGHTPGTSLVAATVQRSPNLNTEQMARLASLFSSRRSGDDNRDRPFDLDSLRAVQNLTIDWVKHIHASTNAPRWQKAAIVDLASRFPDAQLLPLVKEMLDDNLQRLRKYREQAQADGWGDTAAVREARHPHMDEYQRAFMEIDAPDAAIIVAEYLEEPEFGECAARVLAYRWRTANEPPEEKRFRPSIDWSEVKAKRERRTSNPDVTCDEAEVIFTVIDRLIADEANVPKLRLAASLAVIALRLPHGQRREAIRKVLSLAPGRVHESARPDLLLSLVLSGEEIDVADVNAGIAETLEASKRDPWILTQSEGWYLRVWLRLIPFTNSPLEAMPLVIELPEALRQAYALQDMVGAFAYAPSPQAEEFLFRLAEIDQRFYRRNEWWDSVMALETLSSARRLVDLIAGNVANSAFRPGAMTFDIFHFVKRLGELLPAMPELRAYVYSLIKNGTPAESAAMLAGIVSENPDAEGLLLILNYERQGRSIFNWQLVKEVVTEKVPVAGYANAYSLVPVPSAEFRKSIFSLTTDGGARDVAAHWLNYIDELRDNYGLPETEPRHPDLASGKQWPILRSSAEA